MLELCFAFRTLHRCLLVRLLALCRGASQRARVALIRNGGAPFLFAFFSFLARPPTGSSDRGSYSSFSSSFLLFILTPARHRHPGIHFSSHLHRRCAHPRRRYLSALPRIHHDPRPATLSIRPTLIHRPTRTSAHWTLRTRTHHHLRTRSLSHPLPRIASPPRTTASAHSHIYPHASCIVSGRIVLDYSRDCRLDHVVPTRTAIYPPPTLYRYAVDNRPVLEPPSVLFFSLPVPPASAHRPSYIRTPSYFPAYYPPTKPATLVRTPLATATATVTAAVAPTTHHCGPMDWAPTHSWTAPSTCGP